MVLLITPPFVQLNTPYPATTYLKGFLKTKGVESHQADLGIEVVLKIFSTEGLMHLFEQAAEFSDLSPNGSRICALRKKYLSTIDPVIAFLQGKNPDLAYAVNKGEYLPQASRFNELDDLDWAFGNMGIHDKAKHLCTLYLEDLADLIVETVDPHFGFSRYAERLGRAASSFDDLELQLSCPNTYTDEILLELLSDKIAQVDPELVAITIPFPGNLYSGLKIGQWIKKHHPEIRVAMGGGYVNTELRQISDNRVFDYVDFITLDDGEAPILNLIEYLSGKRQLHQLKRTFVRQQDEVVLIDASDTEDFPQYQLGTPDYADLPIDKYLSVIEVVNPMHRLWSDGRWNKLTLAHGCYWGKCTFCDISLDYIARYEPLSASIICDRIEQLIMQTGQNGFHFVDEAAPPSLLKAVALEILKRNLSVVWWTNIRFEKSFTRDLCRLLAASGCIAVSGGLEVASDRLLELIQKGVTVEQVTQVADHFTESGVMVHAYLMYGFPTQTDQETIDSLEIVRQLFMNHVIQSGFWHQFATTVHSPVGYNPDKFEIAITNTAKGTFANNDLLHEDPSGANHELYSEGLKKSLFNYMHGLCFDFHLSEWFDFPVPETTIKPNHISGVLQTSVSVFPPDRSRLVWIGGLMTSEKKKNKQIFRFQNLENEFSVSFDARIASWLDNLWLSLGTESDTTLTFQDFKCQYTEEFDDDFDVFWVSKEMEKLRENGLLAI